MSSGAITGPLGQPFMHNGVVVHTGRYIADLQEGVPWWNNTQGGLTTSDRKILGILIDQSNRTGEYLSSRIIITRLATQVGNQGSMIESRLDAGLEAIASKRPIGVVVTRNHQNLGVSFPGEEHYALMGFWIATAIYFVFSRDDQNRVVKTPMIRLDKIDQTGIWWRSQQQIAAESNFTINDPIDGLCATCLQRGPVIFTQQNTFTCGNRHCATNTDMTNPYMLPAQMTYHPAFLRWRPSMAGVMSTPNYLPPPLSMPRTRQELDHVIANDPKQRPMWSGYLCNICKALNQRVHVSEVDCHKCGNIQHAPPPPLTFEEVSHSDWFNVHDNTNVEALGIRIRGSTTLIQTPMDPDYVIRKWKLHPDVDGHVMVMYPKWHIMFGINGSRAVYNTLNNRLQDGQLDYRRMTTQSPVRGQMTRWFAQNIGKAYTGTSFSSAATNLALANAPQVYRDIMRNLEDIIVKQTGQQPNFNELLAMCYFPNMSMGWHADGEESILGHAVASQSLGGTAIMTFGVSERAWVGRNSHGQVDTRVPIFPGCPKYNERVALKGRADRNEITPAQHLAQLRLLLDSQAQPSDPVWCLQFPLTSGSIMAQIGPLINTYWKHKVDFVGTESRLRFVNTARYLNTTGAPPPTPGPGPGPPPVTRRRGRHDDSSDDDISPPPTRRRRVSRTRGPRGSRGTSGTRGTRGTRGTATIAHRPRTRAQTRAEDASRSGDSPMSGT